MSLPTARRRWQKYMICRICRICSGRRSHGGAEARRNQREESTTRHKGNWRVPCSCLCVKHPWLPTGVLHCPGHPSCAGA
jgi:hypothetical protein